MAEAPGTVEEVRLRQQGLQLAIGFVKMSIAEGDLKHSDIARALNGLDPQALLTMVSWLIQSLGHAIVMSGEQDDLDGILDFVNASAEKKIQQMESDS